MGTVKNISSILETFCIVNRLSRNTNMKGVFGKTSDGNNVLLDSGGRVTMWQKT